MLLLLCCIRLVLIETVLLILYTVGGQISAVVIDGIRSWVVFLLCLVLLFVLVFIIIICLFVLTDPHYFGLYYYDCQTQDQNDIFIVLLLLYNGTGGW